MKDVALENNFMENAYVTEMATRTLKDFKTKSRANQVGRVAKRMNQFEKKKQDL